MINKLNLAKINMQPIRESNSFSKSDLHSKPANEFIQPLRPLSVNLQRNNSIQSKFDKNA